MQEEPRLVRQISTLQHRLDGRPRCVDAGQGEFDIAVPQAGAVPDDASQGRRPQLRVQRALNLRPVLEGGLVQSLRAVDLDVTVAFAAAG